MVLNDLGEDLADVTPKVTIHLLFLLQGSHDLKSKSGKLVITMSQTRCGKDWQNYATDQRAIEKEI